MSDVAKVETACESYLASVSDAKRAMRRLAQDRREMRECIDGLKGVRYDRQGGASAMEHGDDAMAAVVVRLEEIDEKIRSYSQTYADILSEWIYVKTLLPALHAEVLTMHYIEGMTWEAVALEVRYSERNIYRLRWDAMLSLYEVLPQGWQ